MSRWLFLISLPFTLAIDLILTGLRLIGGFMALGLVLTATLVAIVGYALALVLTIIWLALPLTGWIATAGIGYFLLTTQPLFLLAGFPVVGIMISSRQITDLMLQLLKAIYINPLRTYTHQADTVHNDRPPSVLIVFLASQDDFFKIKKAARMAGLYFTSVKWESLSTLYCYSVWVVQDRSTYNN